MAVPQTNSAIIFFMSTKNENIWIPFADIMTALMFIFILIIVLTLSLKQQQESATETKLGDFENTLDELYQELSAAFADKQESWGIKVLEDLTIKFENTNILFTRDSTAIKPEFKNILDEFIPIYLSILSKEKYAGKIKEIKIEGHTARQSKIYNSYIKTIELSQGRARNILDYTLQSSYFSTLTQEERAKMIFLLSANGFGRGRAIDASGEFVFDKRAEISSNSRRVEFKVITNSDELVNQLISIVE